MRARNLPGTSCVGKLARKSLIRETRKGLTSSPLSVRWASPAAAEASDATRALAFSADFALDLFAQARSRSREQVV